MDERNQEIETDESGSKRRSRRQKPFPAFCLRDALEIAQAIGENNACRPFSRMLVAEALGRSPESSAFRQIITSSAAYGLTEGSYKALRLELTPLGLSIVAPKSETEKRNGLVEAAMNVGLYEELYRHFDQHKIPPTENFRNILIREFGIEPADAIRCVELYLEDGKYVGLIREVAGAYRVSIHDAADNTDHDDAREISEALDAIDDADRGEQNTIAAAVEPTNGEPYISKTVARPSRRNRVFISHGKNKGIVEQIKAMLDLGDMEYVVAVETETTAIPVPEKVLSSMHECSAAVICITADEEFRKDDGSYFINENVLIEIGAAFVLYDKRVVLLWDRRLAVPSNLQGLYRCEFEGSELSWTEGMKLMKTLNEFKKAPGDQNAEPTKAA